MSELIRRTIVGSAKLIVIKVGTRVLTESDGTLNPRRIEHLAEQIHGLSADGRQVVLVSSGAVGAGMSRLGLHARPDDLATLQAVAAVGQTKLIEAYDRCFGRHGRPAAQVLLTADDLDDRTRYLNVRNTLRSLLSMGAIPIINENDTVSVEELQTTFGDNDRLAALVTNLLQAPLLVLLSDVEGLYDGPPDQANSKLIDLVESIDDRVMSYVVDRRTGLSKGGMASKLRAARMVTSAGENVLLACGHRENVLRDALSGENIGTVFVAAKTPLTPFKRWLGFSTQSRGEVHLDMGATEAVVKQGRSLLAAGITRVEGDFDKGDAVTLCDSTGKPCARGLTNYSSDELRQIRGLRTDAIADRLGHLPYKTAVHRDNLVVLK
jgi:glutamate 5-kinase